MTRATRHVALVALLAPRERVRAPRRRRPGPLYVRAQAAPDPPPPPAPAVVRGPAARAARPGLGAAQAHARPHAAPGAATKPKRVAPAARVRRQPQGVAGARTRATTSTRSSSTPTSRARSTRSTRSRCASPTSRSSRARRSSAQPGLGRRRAVAPRPRQVDGSAGSSSGTCTSSPRGPSSRPTSPSTPTGGATCSSFTATPTRTWRPSSGATPRTSSRGCRRRPSELAGQQKNASPVVGIDALNFDYTIQVVKGAPAWTPVQVFDDGRRTFVRFPVGHGAARGAGALRASRLRDAARQLPRQERHVRHRPAHRRRGAARRAEGPGDRAHRAHGGRAAASRFTRGRADDDGRRLRAARRRARARPARAQALARRSAPAPRAPRGAHAARGAHRAARRVPARAPCVLAVALAFERPRARPRARAEPSAAPAAAGRAGHDPQRPGPAPRSRGRASTRGAASARSARSGAEDPAAPSATRELDRRRAARGFSSSRRGGRRRSACLRPSAPPRRPELSPTGCRRRAPRRAAAADPNLQDRKNAFLGGKGGVKHGRLPRSRPAAPAKPLRDQGGHGPSGGPHHGHQQRPARARSSRRCESTSTTRSRATPCSCRRAVACIAQYDSMVAWGQERVLLCWNRLVLPNGDSIDLQCMPAADLQGRRGPHRRGRRALVAHSQGRRRRHAAFGGHRLRRGRHHLVQPDRRSGHGAERRGGDRPASERTSRAATSASSPPSPCGRASRSTSSSPRT